MHPAKDTRRVCRDASGYAPNQRWLVSSFGTRWGQPLTICSIRRPATNFVIGIETCRRMQVQVINVGFGRLLVVGALRKSISW